MVLPVCAVGWLLRLLPRGLQWVYLLTGAYIASGALFARAPASPDPALALSWGAQAHHAFTAVLCAFGTSLPGWLEQAGALCILAGEAGNFWAWVVFLHPTTAVRCIQASVFLPAQALATAVAVWTFCAVESPLIRTTLFISAAFITWDNLQTFVAMCQGIRCPPQPFL